MATTSTRLALAVLLALALAALAAPALAQGRGKGQGMGQDMGQGMEQTDKGTNMTGAMHAGAGAKGAMPWKGYRKPGEERLKAMLSPLQFEVTQKEGTERAFDNQYWDNHHAGIYVDVLSGEPLFSSRDKYESGTGWPSFTRPLDPANVATREDRSFFMTRTEVRSVHGDNHLGHVFNDGPAPTGLRYCMNSAAMRFIPVEDLEKEGYGEYLPLFGK